MMKQQVIDLVQQVQLFISSFSHLTEVERNKTCVDGKIIGTGRSDYTRGSTSYDLTIADKSFSLIDIPGIEGDESKFEGIICESLDKAHVIFYVNGSGKKIEKATLEKIKKYMHDGTSVYAIFNVHCKAKKERIAGVDKSYSEELAFAYLKENEIIEQTESELQSFLGENYKGCMYINGLLSFCGLAITGNGQTTIIDEQDKRLRSDQQKYLKEYDYDAQSLICAGRIEIVKDTIAEKVDNLESYIYYENIKKLINRLNNMFARIDFLNTEESAKLRAFRSIYDDFESNCYNAKEDYIQTIRHIGFNAATDAFEDVKTDLFEMLENDRGKTKSTDIQNYFDVHKNQIVEEIQNRINERMAQAQKGYEDAIQDARERLEKDFEREQIHFAISLSAEKLALNEILGNSLKYNWKTFGKDVFQIGSFALSGLTLGSIIPGVGSLIGAAVGTLIGILFRIWNYFVSEDMKVNDAKKRIERAIDEQVDVISEEIQKELNRLNYEEKINLSYSRICDQVDTQRRALSSIEQLLNSVSSELIKNIQKVSWEVSHVRF